MRSDASGIAGLLRRHTPLFFALLALCVVVAHWRIRAGRVALAVEAAGYREIVNRGLADKLSWSRRDEAQPASTASGTREAEAVDRDTSGPLELRLELGELSSAERAFALNSFVLDDIHYPERFARDSGAAPRLRAGFRRRPLPFSESARWRGRLLFRRGAREVRLRSRHGRELFLHAPRDPLAGLPPAEVVSFGKPAEGEAARSGPSFKWTLGGTTAFSLHAVPGPDGGVSAVLERPRESVGSLAQNGAELPPGEQQRTLEPGDWLVLRSRIPPIEEVFFLDHGLSGVISEFRRGREGFERSFAPAAGLEPLARSVAGVYDGLLSLLDEANARNAKGGARPGQGGGPLDGDLRGLRLRDLRLTLDAALQAPAQALLAKRIEAVRPAWGWHEASRAGDLPREPPRAALSVLDLATGELLAAASFPQEDDLERHLEALRRHAGRGVHRRCTRALIDYLRLQHERRRERLLANHVFDEHQVGSTIKPLLAAAFALHWTPGQGGVDPLEMSVSCTGSSGLELKPEEPVPVVPGTDVRMAVYDDPAHGPTDFRQFLARSCNSFMFRLAVEALRATPGFRPELCEGHLEHALGNDPVAHPAQLDEARALTPLGRFAWLTGAFLRDPNSFGAGRRRATWWGAAGAEMLGAVRTLGCDFEAHTLAAVSPAHVNLDVTGLTRCHPNLSSLLKGGGSNRWSNADLSLAYARLVSARALEGRVVLDEPQAAPVPSPSPAPSPGPAFDARDCRQSLACADPQRFEVVRAAVLEGLGAGLVAGTSRGVHDVVARTLDGLGRVARRRWGAYAKTGSSERPLELVARVDDALRPSRGSRVSVDVREANFTLLFLECAEGDDGARATNLGCARLPPLGPGARGFALHLWTDGVPGIKLGGDAARFYNSAEGQALLDRLVRVVEAGS